jgi:thioesterase domain-containing protein/acyl carrier protein
MLGGEPIIVKDVDRVHPICPEIRIMNHYGPTETTIGSIVRFIDFNNFTSYKTNPTIGEPIDNTDVYILDKNLCLLPYGVPGELCIGGEGVGAGYINRPDLTADKFIPDPFKEGSRVYRTGDLARWEADGNIKLLGRIDRQIKLRGYRIELGEIENQLLKINEIKEVVVVNKEGSQGDNYICAFFVSDKNLQTARVREQLEKELPDYMVPSYFMQLENIPLTPHNKIDYKALPRPKEMIQTGKTYEAPTNENEEKIVHIWGEILEIDPKKIGINDNFFELGGNSFNILKVLNRINHEFGQDISLSALFLYSTVKELAIKIFEDLLLNKLECIVKLNHGQNDKNLFIIHPLHGMVYQYVELARLLEDEYNVYGIQVRGMVKRTKFPETFDIMVADYANQILRIQEKGPFYIIGFCFGDFVGYNLTKQIEDLNHEVGVFIMLDEEPFIPKSLSNHYRRKDRIEKILKPVHHFSDLFRKEKHKDAALRRFNHLVAEAEKNEVDSRNKTPISTEEAAKFKVMAKINIKNLVLKYGRGSPYKDRLIGIIKAPLINVNATESKYKFSLKGLSKITYGEVGTTKIETGHNAIFESPHVEKLQAIIKDILKGGIIAVK